MWTWYCVYASLNIVTVREFLVSTSLKPTEIAEACDVHVCQIARWRTGQHKPTGFAAFKLMELSGNEIKYSRKPRRSSKTKAA